MPGFYGSNYHWPTVANAAVATLLRSMIATSSAGTAVADAFICCWKTKYQYHLIRPISCIRAVIAADWNSPIPKPASPEYTPGHSVQSGTAARVLTDSFGDNYASIDRTHDDRGLLSRSFDSFFEFADEDAISRLYGGIHFRSAIEKGLDQGKCIGAKVSELEFEKWPQATYLWIRLGLMFS